MTKVTKTEKILRKATSKWDKFLAEGAFKGQANEVGDPDQYYNDMPGSSDYKYSAAEGFKKGDKIKVRSVKKGYATGGTEPEPENVRCKTGTVKGFDGERLIVMLDNGETVSINGRNASNKEFQWDNEVMFSCPEEQVNEMTMGERGMVDAQDGNPPSKIGHGNEEYMAAFNAVMQKMGKEPLPIVQPDQAYLDALQRGNLEEAVRTDGRSPSDIELVNKVAELMTSDPEFRVLSPYADKFVRYSQSGGSVESSLEAAVPDFVAGRHVSAVMKKAQGGQLEEMGPATGHVEGTDAAGVIRQIAADLGEVSGVMNNASSTTTASEFAGFIQAKANELLEAANELGIDGPAPALQEQEEQGFQVGEFVYVVNGSLKGASGKILEPVTTTTGEEGFAIELYSDAKMKVFGQRGDEVIAVAGDLESGGTSDDMELYDIDEGSKDDERDLEPAVTYASGATLRFNPTTGEFYDVGRDIYLDADEAYALIKETVRKTLSSKKKVKAIKENNPSSFATRVTHSSDPEMDQVMDIAADMLEMPPRSRGTITLKSVQSALEAQSFDTKMERGMLIVDDKYVIAKKELLPKTAQKISFTKYAADYLSNLQGEQQNLPMQ